MTRENPYFCYLTGENPVTKLGMFSLQLVQTGSQYKI